MPSLDEINQNIVSFVSDVKYDKTLPAFCCLLLLSSILNTRICSIWHKPLAKRTPDSKKCPDHEVIGIGECSLSKVECIQLIVSPTLL